jgi:hypothetical protein
MVGFQCLKKLNLMKNLKMTAEVKKIENLMKVVVALVKMALLVVAKIVKTSRCNSASQYHFVV